MLYKDFNNSFSQPVLPQLFLANCDVHDGKKNNINVSIKLFTDHRLELRFSLLEDLF